jgi:hypothetical protein
MMDHRVKVPGVLISAVLLMIFQLRSAQGDGEYFNPFAAWNCQGEECRQVWGNSGLGEMNLEHVASQVVGNGAEVAFMQYSRSNDDTPAGEDPAVAPGASVACGCSGEDRCRGARAM